MLKHFKIRFIKREKHLWIDDAIIITHVYAVSGFNAIEQIKNTPGFIRLIDIEEIP